MATYYRWRRSNAHGEKTTPYSYPQAAVLSWFNYSYRTAVSASIDQSTGKFTFSGESGPQILATDISGASGIFFGMDSSGNWDYSQYYELSNCGLQRSGNNTSIIIAFGTGTLHQITGIGDFIDYVYSTSSSAYPNGGVSGGYYYDQRTTVTSPTAPTGLTYPNPITTPKVTVSWNASTSNVPDISIKTYYLTAEYFTNNNKVSENINVGNATQYQYNIVPGTTSITFQVWAIDNNNQPSAHTIGSTVPVYLAPTLTVPQMVMQGQQATISWTAIEGADSYTLQRKSNTDADWTQVYSGTAVTFSETVGTWTSVQYRVQAVFSGTPGGWAESAAIPVVSASALVISGTDGDLGTVVNDIPYSISTDTGNQITAKITVNSAVIFSGNVGNSTSDTIPVLDLVTGEGTIVIEASVTASSGPVSAVRTWTYTKTMMTFPNAGSIAELTKDGKVMWPETLAEAVRIPGGKTLDQVMGFPCQIYVGSYTGTGTSGSSNPNTIESPFKPLDVEIFAQTETAGPARATIGWVRGVQTGSSISLGDTNSPSVFTGVNLTWNEKSLSWYVSGTAADDAYQFNVSGVTYIYRIIG